MDAEQKMNMTTIPVLLSCISRCSAKGRTPSALQGLKDEALRMVLETDDPDAWKASYQQAIAGEYPYFDEE